MTGDAHLAPEEEPGAPDPASGVAAIEERIDFLEAHPSEQRAEILQEVLQDLEQELDRDR